MRLTSIIAAACFAAAGLSIAGESGAAARRVTTIPPQGLGPALQLLAREHDFQIIYVSEDVNGLRTRGATGELTSEEALTRLLEGSGLSFRYLDDRTITVFNPGDLMPLPAPGVSSVGPSIGMGETWALNPGDAMLLASPRYVALVEGGADRPELDGAGAQNDPQPGRSEPPSLVEPITVTGSRIRGHANPGAQVYTITSEDIEQQGFTTTDDVFRSIPQVSGRGSMAAMDVNEQVPSGSVGHSSVDLGGFGAKSTLVLINGRRTASSSIMYGDSVNVATIPTSAIERVEVLPTAAAAIYGADAVGGVVNIVLKKRATFEANSRLSSENSSYGGPAVQVSQDLSFGWATGRFTGVVSYREADPVTSKALGYTSQDFRSRGGYDLRSQSFGETGGIFGYGSLPPGNDGTAFSPGDVSAVNVVNASSISEYVVPELKSTALYVNVEQDIGPRTMLFLDGIFSKNDTANRETPHNVFFAEVPATNAFNPFGSSVYVNYLFDTERDSGRMPSVFREADQELRQVTLGGEVSLPRDWRLQLYATGADEESLHSFSWVANWADPAVFAALADADPQTALNLFGDGTAQNEATLSSIVSWWQGKRHNKLKSDMRSYVAQADGALFSLPAGPVKASFVAEHREDSLNWDGFGVNQPKGDRTADSIGAEFAVPLLGSEAGAASGQSLEVTLAARWDRYNAKGDFDYDGSQDRMQEFSDTSPMIGLAWKPIDSLRLRASWNQAFRAPVVHDLAGLPFPYQTQVYDPLAPGGPAWVLVDVSYPPSEGLGPENATIWTAGFDWQPRELFGGGLKVSLTYSDTDFTDRISGAYIYFNDDPSYFVSHPEIFLDATERDSAGNLTDVYLRNINISGQEAQVWNLDLGYDWRTGGGHLMRLGAAGGYTAQFNEQVHADAPVEGLQGKYRGPDRLRATLRGGWTSPDLAWSANMYVNLTSGYYNLIPAYAINNPPPGTGAEVVESVSGYTTVDLSGSYQYGGNSALLGGVSITAGVRNVFDEDFPAINLVAGRVLPFDPRRVDVRGRVAFIEIGKKFN